MEWLAVAVEHCQERCERLREELRRAESHHDTVLLREGLGHTTTINTPDGLPEVPVFTHYQPLDGRLTSEVYQRSVLRYEKEKRLVMSGRDIKPRERPTELKFLSKTFQRMWYFGHNTTRDLCAGRGEIFVNFKGENDIPLVQGRTLMRGDSIVLNVITCTTRTTI